MRIVDIEGVNIVVSDDNYNYYWAKRMCGINTDAFKVACRRILGLGPNDCNMDISYVRDIIWGDNVDDKIQELLNSGILEYKEIEIEKQDRKILNAVYAIQREIEINPHDEEFEDDLI